VSIGAVAILTASVALVALAGLIGYGLYRSACINDYEEQNVCAITPTQEPDYWQDSSRHPINAGRGR